MSLNKVMIIGNLGADPELRYTQTQLAVCSLRIATNERRKNASGDWEEHTEWHSVVCFGKSAENCSKFLGKGRQIYIEGRLQTKKYQDQEGKDRYRTEVIADTIQFLGGKGAGDGSFLGSQVEASESGKTEPSSGFKQPSKANNNVSFEDDDIPF